MPCVSVTVGRSGAALFEASWPDDARSVRGSRAMAEAGGADVSGRFAYRHSGIAASCFILRQRSRRGDAFRATQSSRKHSSLRAAVIP